jgi:hypothetical protein
LYLLALKKAKGYCERLRMATLPNSSFHSPLLATNIVVEGLHRVAMLATNIVVEGLHRVAIGCRGIA